MRSVQAPIFGFALIIALLNPLGAHAENVVSTITALISFNPTLGDIKGNIAKIDSLVAKAVRGGAKIIVVPEQATTGFDITKQEALAGLAISYPFRELSSLVAIAKHAGVLIVLGIAEKVPGSDALYNSAVIIQPSGKIAVQRKRLASSAAYGWNMRGDTPFEIYPTRWGDVAVIICADTFLMDWARIATIKGADIILLPTNWWGSNHQIELWQARAKQDGVWILAANRWGREPNLFPPPNNYYMSDGPSAVISPSGVPILVFEADEAANAADSILYQRITVNGSRIGGGNPSFTVANRRPSAYVALANPYYVPPQNIPVPNLPPAGIQPVQLLAYAPSNDPVDNLHTVSSALRAAVVQPDSLIVLPGLGLAWASIDPIANTKWYEDKYWTSVTALVNEYGAQGLITTVLVKPRGAKRASLAVVFIGPQHTVLYPEIHDSGDLIGSGLPPPVLMLKHAAIALATGIDSLFPEIGTQVAKSGADMLIIPSVVAGRGDAAVEAAGIEASLPRGWTIDDLVRQWQSIANGCMHVVASDASGYGFAADQAPYCSPGQTTLSSSVSTSLSFDTNTQRKKLLNWYYNFDLKTLLGPTPLNQQ